MAAKNNPFMEVFSSVETRVEEMPDNDGYRVMFRAIDPSHVTHKRLDFIFNCELHYEPAAFQKIVTRRKGEFAYDLCTYYYIGDM